MEKSLSYLLRRPGTTEDVEAVLWAIHEAAE